MRIVGLLTRTRTHAHLHTHTVSGVVAFQQAATIGVRGNPSCWPRAQCRELTPASIGSTRSDGVAMASVPSVTLASSIKTPHFPTTVLLHGLDSSKETWSGVLADLAAQGYPAMALDLRGHGESPLGDPAAFGPETLARDVIAAIKVRLCCT